jgi:hypothetical protein
LQNLEQKKTSSGENIAKATGDRIIIINKE